MTFALHAKGPRFDPEWTHNTDKASVNNFFLLFSRIFYVSRDVDRFSVMSLERSINATTLGIMSSCFLHIIFIASYHVKWIRQLHQDKSLCLTKKYHCPPARSTMTAAAIKDHYIADFLSTSQHCIVHIVYYCK